jgi:hypothetical protein
LKNAYPNFAGVKIALNQEKGLDLTNFHRFFILPASTNPIPSCNRPKIVQNEGKKNAYFPKGKLCAYRLYPDAMVAINC